jgi:hypothetical protein
MTSFITSGPTAAGIRIAQIRDFKQSPQKSVYHNPPRGGAYSLRAYSLTLSPARPLCTPRSYVLHPASRPICTHLSSALRPHAPIVLALTQGLPLRNELVFSMEE